MSEILKRVGIVWLIFSIATVYIDSAPPDKSNPPPDKSNPPPDKNNPPPGPPPDKTSPGLPPTHTSGLLSSPSIPLCSQELCSKRPGRRFFPLANNCTFYIECDGNSDPKFKQCGPGELFNKDNSSCEQSQDESICLNCSSTATPRSSSTTSKSVTLSSITPSSTTLESTTARLTTSKSTAGHGVSSSTLSLSTSAVKAEATTSATETTTSVAIPTDTTKQSVATSMTTATSTDSSDGVARIDTTSTFATATRSTSSYTDAGGANSVDTTTWTIVSSTQESVTSSTTSSTTDFSRTDSTSTTASTSSTTSGSDAVSTLSTGGISTVSTVSRSTSVPSSIASSLAIPSSSLTPSGNPGSTTSSLTVSDVSSGNSKTVTTSHGPTSSPIAERFRREILFTRVSPEIVSEGTELEFECAFIWQTDYGNARIDEFIWILNGKQVESTGRIVIHQPTAMSSDDFWKSTISFKPALSLDSGNLTCCATTSGFINSTYYLYEVLPKPRVMVTPLLTTVRVGENALLNCTASVTIGDSNKTIGDVRRLTWLGNDHVLRIDVYPDSSTNSSTKVIISELNLTSPDSNVNIRCLVETSLVNVSSGDAIVRVLNTAPRNPCPSETAAGIDWGVTPRESVDIQPCPNGRSGLARRGCKSDSTWESPNLDKCIAKKFIDLENEVNLVKYRNGVLDNVTMTRLAEDIAEVIVSSENMTTGEIEILVEIISSMADIHTGGGLQIALGPAELRAMIKAFDYLLNVSSWARASKNLAISLLASINVYSDMYSQQQKNGAIFIVSRNLVFEADGMQSYISGGDSDSRFPDWTKVNWTTEDAAFWARSDDNVISMKRQTAFKLMQHSGSSGPGNFTSSCIRNLGNYLPLTDDQKRKGSYINSHIISLTFTGRDVSSGQDGPFVISAQHLETETNKSVTGVCVFWNFSANVNESWMEFGCTTVSSNKTHTSCKCNHLTNFAILMSPVNADGLHEIILSIYSMVGCIISVIALALTILFYLTQWKKMKSKRAAVLINLCIALIIANIVFLAGSDKTQSEAGCTVVAALLHYFFLAAFFLMLLEGVMLLIYVIFVFYVHRTSHTIAMIVAAWLIPAIIVGISLGVTKTKGYGTKTTCWLSVENNVLWAFVAPALFIILVNLIIIVIVLSRIASARKVQSDLKKKRNKIVSILRNIVILSPLMGVTWIFGVLSVSRETVAFQYIFAITNSLQGLFIFILHGLCHTKNKKSSSSSSKQKTHRGLTGALSRSTVPCIQLPLSGTDSQEDLVTPTKAERELCAEEELHKQNSVHKVRFGHQLSNTSNGTALTFMSNTSSSNGRPPSADDESGCRL